MTIKEYLKGTIHYEPAGQMIFCNKEEMGDSLFLTIGDVRGWGQIQYLFPNLNKAAKFQDELGEFIAEAIREKLEKL
jgi:hypothetical protein